MYCRNCGALMDSDAKQCTQCGTLLAPSAGTDKFGLALIKKENLLKKKGLYALIGILLILALLFLILFLRTSSDMKEYREELEAEQQEEALNDSAEVKTIVGRWGYGKEEIVFTNDGKVMFGVSGFAFGDDWLSYELIGDTTLYISGEGIPAGVVMEYELVEDLLMLGLDGKYISFNRK